jgi:hypothetical protein
MAGSKEDKAAKKVPAAIATRLAEVADCTAQWELEVG